MGEVKEYRCTMADCRALLFKGALTEATVEVKCRCGVTNTITTAPKINGRAKPYQDRLALQKK